MKREQRFKWFKTIALQCYYIVNVCFEATEGVTSRVEIMLGHHSVIAQSSDMTERICRLIGHIFKLCPVILWTKNWKLFSSFLGFKVIYQKVDISKMLIYHAIWLIIFMLCSRQVTIFSVCSHPWKPQYAWFWGTKKTPKKTCPKDFLYFILL